MKVFLICDDELFGRSIRQVMLREGVDCPTSSRLTFSQASHRLSVEPAELIIAVLPDDPLQSLEALDLLAAVPRGERTLVIAVGPAADARLVIRALRGVVDDYVDINEMESELIKALAIWRQKWALDQPEGQLIAILGPNGGAGSSTIAVNLAVQIAKELKSVALIDLKLETGDLAALLDLKPTYSLADLCKNIDRLDQEFFQRALVPHASGIQLLAAPKLLSEVEVVTPEGVREAVGLARAMFPAVVVDLDHDFGENQMQVLRQADVILVVLRLDFISLKNTDRFLIHLSQLGIPMDRVQLVVNRYGQPRELPFAKVEEALKRKVFHTLPDDPKVVNCANNHGVPVMLDAPSSRFSKSLSKLALALKALPRSTVAKECRRSERSLESRPPTQQRWDQAAPQTLPSHDPKPHVAATQAPARIGREWRN